MEKIVQRKIFANNDYQKCKGTIRKIMERSNCANANIANQQLFMSFYLIDDNLLCLRNNLTERISDGISDSLLKIIAIYCFRINYFVCLIKR